MFGHRMPKVTTIVGLAESVANSADVRLMRVRIKDGKRKHCQVIVRIPCDGSQVGKEGIGVGWIGETWESVEIRQVVDHAHVEGPAVNRIFTKGHPLLRS